MPGGDDARAKEVFGEAAELRGAARREYLEAACAGETELRARVETLLAAAEKDDRFLRAPPWDQPETLLGATERVGGRIGPYKLLQQIGEGGFGVVFMAEQERPVRRRVALKVIKVGMDTRATVARFEQERQALALMDHANIAKVFDAGATEAGRPYFVMELVAGEPITEYADRHNLTIAQRLELFVQVCSAIQHAHTKGVIHRDIKPSNVIVREQDGRALARVIDFGIAKATGSRFTEKTVFTEFRQLIGTPEYMSPEQAGGGLDVDTRTDVYSLGVLLYELLTGSTPFDPEQLRSAAYAELQRIIREVEPPKPSTRLLQSGQTLPTVAACRRIEPGKLGTVIRGDLDWIVMKALEKDRARRYDSPSGLAADVLRYAAGEAVMAAPPTTSYRLRKFVRRHRFGVSAAALVSAALVLGVAGTSLEMFRAQAQRDRAVGAERLARDRLDQAERARADAERANKIANAVTEFFTLDVLDLTPPAPGQPEVTVRQALDRVPAKIEKFFKGEPAVEGTIRERVGQLYFNMGDPRRAAAFLEQAVPLLERGLGADDRATLRARQRLGELMLDLERYDVAEDMFDKTYVSRLRVLGPDANFTLHSLMRRGYARVWGGKIDQGVRDAEQGLAEFTRARGAISQATFLAARDVVECYLHAGRLADAERLARSSLEEIRAHPEQIGPAEPEFRQMLAETLLAQGHPEQALEEIDPVYAQGRRQLSESDADLIKLRRVRAQALTEAHRDAEAAVELEALYRMLEPLYGAETERCRSLARERFAVAEHAHDDAAAAAWRDKR